MRRLSLLILLACVGCAAPRAYDIADTRGTYTQRALDTSRTIGDIRAQLAMQIASVQDLPNGNKLWTFTTAGSTALPLPSGPNNRVQWVGVQQSCTVQMEATATGTLVRGFFQGNSCP